MRYFHIIFLLISIFLIQSCVVDEQCRQNKYVEMKVDFFHVKASAKRDTVTISTLTIDSITVRGLAYNTTTSKYEAKDSIIYNDSKSVSTIDLPLHKLSTISKYQIKLNAITDTLTVVHTNTDSYLSLECGCLKFHTINSVASTRHFVDSVSISNSNVNTSHAENIRIYK